MSRVDQSKRPGAVISDLGSVKLRQIPRNARRPALGASRTAVAAQGQRALCQHHLHGAVSVLEQRHQHRRMPLRHLRSGRNLCGTKSRGRSHGSILLCACMVQGHTTVASGQAAGCCTSAAPALPSAAGGTETSSRWRSCCRRAAPAPQLSFAASACLDGELIHVWPLHLASANRSLLCIPDVEALG